MERGAWWVAGLVALAGCTGAGQVEEDGVEASAGFYADSAPPTRDQARELESVGQVDEVAFRPLSHDLALLRGPALGRSEGDPAAAALAFVAARPASFAGAELRIESVREDPDGGSVVHADQLASGRRVLEGAVAFSFDAAGNLVQVAGSTWPVQPLPEAKLAYGDAEDTARSFVASQLPDAHPLVVSDEAVVSGGRGAYRVLVEANPAAGPTRRAVLVDDQTGAVLGDEEELQFGTAHGRGVFNEPRTFEVSDLGNGRLAMVDQTRGQGIATYAWSGGGFPGDLVSSGDGVTWDATGFGRGSAVDAHANAEVVFDYYRDVHGRSGLDGRGAAILSTVHYGQRYDNAFWDGAQMVYGDGDGQTFAPLAGGLDVVAHELTHGVSQFSCRLGHAGQPGALNEAISDAFASFVQLRAGNGDQAWKIGAAIYTPGRSGDALRDLSDPRRLGQPDHMSLYDDAPQDAAHDNGAVHENATIAGHAFFLMAMGGTNKTSGRSAPGIGAAHAEQVLYHALTHGLTAHADFAQCARACVASAQMLFGPREAASVRAAWEAVGVLMPSSAGAPLPSGKQVEGEPNNTRRKASPLAPGTLQGEITDEQDVDYFRFEVAAATDLEVDLGNLGDDLDLRLYDARGRILARSEQAGTRAERIAGRAQRGAYYLRVFAPSGTRPSHAGYTLSLREVSP